MGPVGVSPDGPGRTGQLRAKTKTAEDVIVGMVGNSFGSGYEFAEELLESLAGHGYVLVQLPEPSEEDIDDDERPKTAGDYLKRCDTRSEVWVEGIPGDEPYVFFGRRGRGPSYMPGEYARDVAAALLAASLAVAGIPVGEEAEK